MSHENRDGRRLTSHRKKEPSSLRDRGGSAPHREMSVDEGYSLNKLDTFVFDQLPEVITKDKETLPECGARYAGSLEFLAIHPSVLTENALAQTLLNLKMVEAATVHSGMNAPQSLVRLIDRLSGSETIGSLTYEDLVFVNQEPRIRYESHNGHTFGVMEKPRTRTFTAGEVGETEGMFYRNHTEIEECLGNALALIEGLQSSLTPDELEKRYEEINGELNAAITLTKELGEMPVGHFKEFRQFLTSHPVRGYKGPSGAFTAKIPILECMLRGESLGDSYRNYIQDNIRYFPRRDREKLETVQRQPSLTRMYLDAGKPPELLPLLENVHEFLKQFRATHYRSVAAQIPEAIRQGGSVAGTGGEINPGQFLRERMRQQTPWRA